MDLERLEAELHAARQEAHQPAPQPASRPASRIHGLACPLCRNLANKIGSSDTHARYRCTACDLRFNVVRQSLQASWEILLQAAAAVAS